MLRERTLAKIPTSTRNTRTYKVPCNKMAHPSSEDIRLWRNRPIAGGTGVSVLFPFIGFTWICFVSSPSAGPWDINWHQYGTTLSPSPLFLGSEEHTSELQPPVL